MWYFFVYILFEVCIGATPGWINSSTHTFQTVTSSAYIQNLQGTLQSIFNTTNFYTESLGTCWCKAPPPFVYIDSIVSSQYISYPDEIPVTAYEQFYLYTLLDDITARYINETTPAVDGEQFLLSYKYTGPVVIETWNCTECGSACDKSIDYSTFYMCPYCTEGSALNRCPLPKYYADTLPPNCSQETLGSQGLNFTEWLYIPNTSIPVSSTITINETRVLIPPVTTTKGTTIQSCQTALLVSPDEGIDGGFFCFNGKKTEYVPRNFTTHPTYKDTGLLWARVDGQYSTCKEYMVTASTSPETTIRYYGTIMDTQAAARITSLSEAFSYVESHYNLRSNLNASVDQLESNLTPNQFWYNAFTIRPTKPVNSPESCFLSQTNGILDWAVSFDRAELVGVGCPNSTKYFCQTPKTSKYGYAVCDIPSDCSTFAPNDTNAMYGCPTVTTYAVSVCALDETLITRPLTHSTTKDATMYTLCAESQYTMLMHCITVLHGCPAIQSLHNQSCVCDLTNNIWCRNQSFEIDNTLPDTPLEPFCTETNTKSIQTRNSFYALDKNLSPFELTHPYNWATVNDSNVTSALYSGCAYPFPVPNATECSDITLIQTNNQCHQINKIACTTNTDCPATRPLCIEALKFVKTKEDCINALGPDVSFYACTTNKAVWCGTGTVAMENMGYHTCNLTGIACADAPVNTEELVSGCPVTNVVGTASHCAGAGRLCASDEDCVGPGKQICSVDTGTCAQACFADYNTIVPIPLLVNAYRDAVIDFNRNLFVEKPSTTLIVPASLTCNAESPTCSVSQSGVHGHCTHECTMHTDCPGTSLCIGTEVFVSDLQLIVTEADCYNAGGTQFGYCSTTGVVYCNVNNISLGYTPCTGSTEVCVSGGGTLQYNACPTTPVMGTNIIIENGQCSLHAGAQYYKAAANINDTFGLSITFYDGDLCNTPDTTCNNGHAYNISTVQPSIYLNKGYRLQCSADPWVLIKPDIDLQPPTEHECMAYMSSSNNNICEYETNECQSIVLDRENIKGISVTTLLDWIETTNLDLNSNLEDILQAYIQSTIHGYGIRKYSADANTSSIIMNQNILHDFLRMQYYMTIEAWNVAYPLYPIYGPPVPLHKPYSFWLFVQNYTIEEETENANVFNKPCGFIACNLCLPTYTLHNQRLLPNVYTKSTSGGIPFVQITYTMDATTLASAFYTVATTMPVPCSGYVGITDIEYVSVSYQECSMVCIQGYICDGVPNEAGGSDCNQITNATVCANVPGCMVCTPGAFIIPPSPPPYTPITPKTKPFVPTVRKQTRETELFVLKIVYLVIGILLCMLASSIIGVSIYTKNKQN